MVERIKRTYKFPPPQNSLGSAGQGSLHELSDALTALNRVTAKTLTEEHVRRLPCKY
jgi:hypothetical protein